MVEKALLEAQRPLSGGGIAQFGDQGSQGFFEGVGVQLVAGVRGHRHDGFDALAQLGMLVQEMKKAQVGFGGHEGGGRCHGALSG